MIGRKQHTVHVICWDGVEYKRQASEREIDNCRRQGCVDGKGYEGITLNFKRYDDKND